MLLSIRDTWGKKMKIITLSFYFVLCLFLGCSKASEKPLTIAINPWPGYEFMYLAETKGFFKEAGVNVQLVQLDSLSDVQRAYLNGHVDGMASTIIEAVQVSQIGTKPLKIVMVPDYSNGGDVIIGPSAIANMTALKGMKVGAEVSSLGIYILQRALAKSGMTLEDIELVNTKQEDAQQLLLDHHVDAVVTYPPFSIDILKHDQFKSIFTSAEIPFEVIDTISVSEEVLNQRPQLAEQLRTAWQRALVYTKSNPDESYEIMAKRENISVEDFKATLSELVILSKVEQDELFAENKKLSDSVLEVCKTLVHIKALETDCSTGINIVMTR